MPDSPNPLILYDGLCGLCNRLVRFVLRHDIRARFRFASLQSDHAARILQRHALEFQELDTIYVVDGTGERPKDRTDAVIFILRELGGFWRVAATVLRIFPRPLRDWGYRIVAGHRYRVFGKYESCPLPEAKYQDRFLEI